MIKRTTPIRQKTATGPEKKTTNAADAVVEPTEEVTTPAVTENDTPEINEEIIDVSISYLIEDDEITNYKIAEKMSDKEQEKAKKAKVKAKAKKEKDKKAAKAKKEKAKEKAKAKAKKEKKQKKAKAKKEKAKAKKKKNSKKKK